MQIKDFVLAQIQKEYTISSDENIETFNYVESGFVDSMGLLQFIVEVEDEYQIEFTQEEISDPSFQIVGDLIKLIERKVNHNE